MVKFLIAVVLAVVMIVAHDRMVEVFLDRRKNGE
jgi:hypothetical protein